MSDNSSHKWLQPFKMRPLLFEKIWGSSRLCAQAGKTPHGLDKNKIGESWEVADLKEGCSVVEGGTFDGVSLRTLVEDFGKDLVGEASLDAEGLLRFPLLVKLIDTSADLSVQVHPSVDNAHLFQNAASKDECWWVLDADQNAQLASGLVSSHIDRATFEKALAEKKPEALLRFVDIKADKALHIYPGCVHAIGKGVFLLEVQEPSDTTFRVWDYERPGLDGKQRELHVEQALKALSFGKQRPAFAEPELLFSNAALAHFLIVKAPSYRLERLVIKAHANLQMQKNTKTPWVVSTTHTPCQIKVGTTSVELSPYSTCIVPALAGRVGMHVTQESSVLISGLNLGVLVEKVL